METEWRVLAWWLACMVMGLAALPLGFRAFRFLPDRGAGLTPALGIALTHLVAWWLGLEWFGGAAGTGLPRAAVLLVCAMALTWGGWRLWKVRSFWHRQPTFREQYIYYYPALLTGAVGLLHLPHGTFSVWLSVFLVGGASAAAWAREPRRLVQTLRTVASPLVVSQILFAAGFLVFLNIRSFFPGAIYMAGAGGAEKFGNLMFLNSMMQATSFPPADAWFMGETVNYYYGGHLIIAGIAKAIGMSGSYAFNFGLATIFALTLSTAFSLVYNLTARRARRVIVGKFIWHKGMGWGVLGAAAVALFGNLDAWIQYFAFGNRYGWSDVATWFDYWRSSRVIHGAPQFISDAGTITEFPYFSAILGDLHPHHMALPFSICAMTAVIAFIRQRNRGEASNWWKSNFMLLALSGLLLGLLFTINIWDTIVLGPLVLVAVMVALREIKFAHGWNYAAALFAFLMTVLIVSLFFNLTKDIVPVFSSTRAFFLAIVFLLLAIFYAKHPPWVFEHRDKNSLFFYLIGIILAALAIGGGAWKTTRIYEGEYSWLLIALRDIVLFFGSAACGALLAFRARSKTSRFLSGGIIFVAFVALVAGVVLLPFKLFFHSPIAPAYDLLFRNYPPIFHPFIYGDTGDFWQRLWQGLILTPLPVGLRTSLPDYFIHWGIFVIPILSFLGVYKLKAIHQWPSGKKLAIGMCSLVLFVVLYNAMQSLVGPFALLVSLLCLVLLFRTTSVRARAVFTFLLIAFFFHWFVESLYFDDQYSGYLERYNTLFKLYYPLWPMLAAAAVYSLSFLMEYAEMKSVGSSFRRIVYGLPVLGLVLLFALLGLVYPFGANASRMHDPTGDKRSLNAVAYLNDREELDDDHKAIEWLLANQPEGLILEAPPILSEKARPYQHASYSPIGRFSATTGVPTVIGWAHHEQQWRGWNVKITPSLRRKFSRWLDLANQNPYEVNYQQLVQLMVRHVNVIYMAHEFNPIVEELLSFYNIQYVVIGSLEKKSFGNSAGLQKFDEWERVFSTGNITIYKVPNAYRQGGGVP